MSGALFPGGPAEAAAWAAELPAGAFGRAGLACLAETGSTQDEAFAAAARGAAHGAAFVADYQTAGRGRRGSAWVAPRESALLLSVLLRPAPAAARSGRTALAAAVAAARAVEAAAATGAARVEIKWPNDLLLGGRKLGGALIESRGGCAALGLGLNVSQQNRDFPPELRGRTTSLAAELDAAPPRRELLAALLAELGSVFVAAEFSDGQWASLRSEAQERLAGRGRPVRAAEPGKPPVSGRLLGLDAEGRIVLESDGRQTTIASGNLEV